MFGIIGKLKGVMISYGNLIYFVVLSRCSVLMFDIDD